MSTLSNLNEMTWSERRALDQREFNANRDRAQQHVLEQQQTTPMTTEEAGAAWGPPAPVDPPRRITVRDVQRTIAESGVEQTIPVDGRLRSPRDRQ